MRQLNKFADQLLKGGKRHFPYLLLLTSEAVCPIKLYGILAQIHLSLGKMANTNTLYAVCVKTSKKTDIIICIICILQDIYLPVFDFKDVLLDWLGVQCESQLF